MGSADGDGGFILAHHLPEKLCPCEGGDPLFLHGKEFRVIGMDGAGVDDQIDIVRYIFPPLAVSDQSALFREHFRQGGTLVIGTGYSEALGKQNFRQSAHTDAADADKVNMYWSVKMNLIHRNTPFL